MMEYYEQKQEYDMNKQNRRRSDSITITMQENELYQEIELYHDSAKIGEAEVDLKNHMLAKLIIYEPYQNQGFGTEIVKMLVEKYDLNNLWVRADNNRAIHVYEKCGFKIKQSTMFEMFRESKEE